jgi:hypothetical protein
MVTYTWSITGLKTYSSDDNTDVVQLADWEITGEDGSFTATTSGTTAFGAPEFGFVDFQDLTEDLVISWVKGALGEARVNEAEGVVFASLEAQTYQPKPLPWVQPKKLTDKATAVPTP